MTKKIIKALTLLMIVSLSLFSLNADDKKATKKQIIVGYDKSANQKDIKALEEKFDIKVVKKFKRIYAICYEIPQEQDTNEIINKIQEEKIVKYAEQNGRVAANKS